LCEGGTNDGIRLVQQRRRRRARSYSSDCHGKQDGLYHDVPPRNQRLEVLAKRNPLLLRKKEKSSAALVVQQNCGGQDTLVPYHDCAAAQNAKPNRVRSARIVDFLMPISFDLAKEKPPFGGLFPV
jgi:hypothetical protein